MRAASTQMGVFLNYRVAGWGTLLIVLGILPWFGFSSTLPGLLFTALVWIIASVAWNLLGGVTGQVSFGFAVFYGLGAYAAAMGINGGLHPLAAFTISGLVAALASIFIGLPTFRLRGPYFAIATIGVSETVRVVATNLAFTGGASGYRIGELRVFSQAEHYYTALVLATVAIAVSYRISNHKFGLGLMAINQDED